MIANLCPVCLNHTPEPAGDRIPVLLEQEEDVIEELLYSGLPSVATLMCEDHARRLPLIRQEQADILAHLRSGSTVLTVAWLYESSEIPERMYPEHYGLYLTAVLETEARASMHSHDIYVPGGHFEAFVSTTPTCGWAGALFRDAERSPGDALRFTRGFPEQIWALIAMVDAALEIVAEEASRGVE